MLGKKIKKNDFCPPPEKFSCYALVGGSIGINTMLILVWFLLICPLRICRLHSVIIFISQYKIIRLFSSQIFVCMFVCFLFFFSKIKILFHLTPHSSSSITSLLGTICRQIMNFIYEHVTYIINDSIFLIMHLDWWPVYRYFIRSVTN